MTDLTSKLSLNEFLRIFIPGVFISMLFDIIILQGINSLSIIFLSESYSTIIFIIFSLISGMFFSSLDLPKRLWFFKNNIPVNKIYKDTEIKSEGLNITNVYFKFYDTEVTPEFKYKTEKDTGFYHLCMNLAIISVLYLLPSVFIYGFGEPKTFFLIGSFIFTLLSSLTIFYLKVKINFLRQSEMFRNSSFFKEIKDQTTSST